MQPLTNQPLRSPLAKQITQLSLRAVEALGSEEIAKAWLTTVQSALGGRGPSEVAKTPAGITEVTKLLITIEANPNIARGC